MCLLHRPMASWSSGMILAPGFDSRRSPFTFNFLWFSMHEDYLMNTKMKRGLVSSLQMKKSDANALMGLIPHP